MTALATMSAAVALLVGHPVAVTCTPTMPLPTWNAYYTPLSPHIYVQTVFCRRLAALTEGYRPQDRYAMQLAAYPLWLLGHEAGHARGTPSEEQADRFGLRMLPRVAAAFGLDRKYASRLRSALAAAPDWHWLG
jgi:hypothetical protein